MSNERRIREDEHGPYVLTGGYAFRPPAESKLEAGDYVRATHVGGTTTARVGDELWSSYSADPRYIEYVYPEGVPEELVPFLRPLPEHISGVKEPLLEALHVSPEFWGAIRAAILARFPGLDIVRLPDSEEGIRSWGISPKEMPTS